MEFVKESFIQFVEDEFNVKLNEGGGEAAGKLELVHTSLKQAIAFEKQVNGWTRKKKEALIEKNWDKIKELAVCINESSHTNYRKNRTPFDSAQGDKT